MGYHLRDARRSAAPSISGYHYQFAYTALRWWRCRAGDILYCEGNEDIDQIFSGGRIEEIQLKKLSGSISAASGVVRDTLTHFAEAFHEHHDGGRKCGFAFTTTAKLGGRGHSALQRWLGRKNFDVDELVSALRTSLTLPLETSRFLDGADHWKVFISTVRWQLGAPSLERYRRQLREAIARDPKGQGLDPVDVADRMTVRVLEKSGQRDPNARVLTARELDLLLNDIWLSKAVADYGATNSAETVYVATATAQGPGRAGVAVLLDDEPRALREYAASCQEQRARPGGGEVDSLQELNARDDGKFISRLGFDVYAIVDTTGSSEPEVVVQDLLPYLSARGASHARVVGAASALSVHQDPECVVGIVPVSAESLGAALATLLAGALLDTWERKTFNQVTTATFRKIRVVSDIAEHSYFTQADPPPWASS
jgi:hypothetical protein